LVGHFFVVPWCNILNKQICYVKINIIVRDVQKNVQPIFNIKANLGGTYVFGWILNLLYFNML